MRLLPQETIKISTQETEEEIVHCLQKLSGNYNGAKTELLSGTGRFTIHRFLQTRSRTHLIAAGSVSVDKDSNKNLIQVELTAKDKVLVFFFAIVSSIILATLLLVVYTSVKERTFPASVFFLLFFIFIIYGVSILSIQGAIDELRNDIIKALK